MNHQCYWIKTCCRIKISMKLALANTTTTTTQRRYICMIISKSSSCLFLFFLFLFHFCVHFAVVLVLPVLRRQRKCFDLQSFVQAKPLGINGEWLEKCYYCYLFRCRLSSVFPELSACALKVNIQFCLLAKEQIGGFPTCEQLSVPVSKQEQIFVILERSNGSKTNRSLS